MFGIRRLLRASSLRSSGLVRNLIVPPEYADKSEPSKDFNYFRSHMSKSGLQEFHPPSEFSHPNPPLKRIRKLSQDSLPTRSMFDSYSEFILRLSDSSVLRTNYMTSMGNVRLGKLLEDMDIFAAYVLMKHISFPEDFDLTRDFSIVTAIVDRVEILRSPDVNRDIKIAGHVSWTGESSAEILLYLFQKIDERWDPVITSNFVFVVRNADNTGPGVINRLIPRTSEEQKYFDAGKTNKINRLKFAQASLLENSPSEEEKEIIHDFFKKTLDSRAMTFKARVKPSNSVWMENAKLKSVLICQPEYRNLINKIFGGFIMKKAVELAWANAYVFSNKVPVITHIDDIHFKKPVEIGSLLYYSSQVCYTSGNKIQMRVSAESVKPDTGECIQTNEFQFTFKVNEEIPSVIPKTYHEAMLFLHSRRHFLNCNDNHG